MLSKNTYLRLSKKLKSARVNPIFKKISLVDILSFIMGFLFFISSIKYYSNQSELLVKYFNIMCLLTIVLFLLQKEDIFSRLNNDYHIYQIIPLKTYKLKQMDFLIDYKEIIRSIFYFRFIFTFYLIISFGLLFILAELFIIILLSLIIFIVNGLLKTLVILLANFSSLFYRIKNLLLSLILSISFFFINHNLLEISSNKFFITNLISDLFYNEFLIFDYKNLFFYFSFLTLIFLLFFFIFSRINLKFMNIENNKKIKLNNKSSYQNDTIKTLVSSITMKDSQLSSFLLEYLLGIITSFIWTTFLLSLTGLFDDFKQIIIAVSIVSSFRAGFQASSFLYSKTPYAINFFKSFPYYNDFLISKTAISIIFVRNLFFIIIPIFIINIFMHYPNFYLLINLILIYFSLFCFSLYLSYKNLLKYKPFQNSKSFGPKIDLFASDLSHLIIVVFSFVLLPILKFNIFFLSGMLILLFPFNILFGLLFLRKHQVNIYPFIKQKSNNDCAIACLKMLAAYYQKTITLENENFNNNELSFNEITLLAQKANLNIRGYKLDNVDFLINNLKVHPFIAQIEKNGINHFILVYETQENGVIIGDPSNKNITFMKLKKFKIQFTNNILKCD